MDANGCHHRCARFMFVVGTFDLMANMIEKLVRHNADHKSHFKIITLHMMEIDNDEFTVMGHYTDNVLFLWGGAVQFFPCKVICLHCQSLTL